MKALIWLLTMVVVSNRCLDTQNNINQLFNECKQCCQFPKNLKNAKIVPQFGKNIDFVPNGMILLIRCPPKYQQKGKRVTCKNGRWVPALPNCISTSCQPPPLIEHGEFMLQSHYIDFPVNFRVKYKCDNGYQLQGNDELVCIKKKFNLVWSEKAPICTVLSHCKDPGVSPDGYRMGTCCIKGSILKYQCKPGFFLIGAQKIVCLDEEWSDHRPLCQPDKYCPEPPVISHGRIVGSKPGDFYVNDDQISIECEEGYIVDNGNDMLFCEEGHWDEEFSNCIEIKCKIPKIPENGFIHEVNQTTFPFESEVNFGCQEGFLLIGNSWTACKEFGWSNPSPFCRKIRCPNPSVPEDGWKKGNSYEVGDTVEFGCFSGYQLLGSSKRECLPNGKWNGELTRCNSKQNDCPDPGIPINGYKIGRFYNFGNVVEFKCNPGKQLIGSRKRVCLKDGEWSGSETICLDNNDFDQKEAVSSRLKEVINAEITEQKDILNEHIQAEHSNIVKLSRAIDLNHPNRLIFYFVFDISGSIGTENFRKSINFAKLLVKKIGVSEKGTRVGAMTFSDKAVIRFYPMIYSTTEDVINALDEIQFAKGGGTATRLALRMLREQMIHLTEETLKGAQKPIVFLMTDGKANMEGDPMRDAEELKKYGVEIYCIGITGDRNMKTLYNIATTKDEHVFILDSYDTIDWLVQDIINGTIDYSANCGIQKSVLADNEENIDDRGRIVGGKKALYPWPWMAALYVADNFDPDLSKARHRCGGSIIDKSWILTAAHCLHDRKGIPIDKQNIIVNLGLLNVKNHSNLQTFSVEKYIIHPEYIRKTHHNDIALIKLNRVAEFNMFVRPVCLPLPYSELPKETKFYREGERAVAIGWGYNKPVKMNEEAGNLVNHLKRINLPIQNSITCRNSLNSSYEFTDNMFCAGRGKGNADTCKGDSGGPLMQSMKNDLGQTYWTQVGIISWGIGCAQIGTYGFYTQVAKLKEWIESTKQTEQ